MIKEINKFIKKRSMLIFTIFLYLQPLLDAITGIMQNQNMHFKTAMVLKILFFIYALYYVVFVVKKNLKYVCFLCVYSLVFFITNIFLKSDGNLFLELEILIKSLYLPVMLLFVLTLFKENKFNIKHLYYILLIYVLLIFIPDVLKISFNSYAYAKEGSVGFFYSANAIGGVLSFIMPILVAYLVKNKKIMLLILFSLIYTYIIFTMGTKAPILCMLIVILYFVILFIIKLFKNKKYLKLITMFMIILLTLIVFIKVIPKTAFYKNLVIHLEFLKIKKLTDLLTFKNFDHFIFSGRLSFLKESFLLFKDSSFVQKLFGIGYFFNGEQIKTSEMDFFVTFIHQGIFGFLLVYYAYFKCMFVIFKNYFNDFKDNFVNLKRSSLILSLIISILSAFLAGHVLETPSVSIFVVTIMASTYYLLKKEKH